MRTVGSRYIDAMMDCCGQDVYLVAEMTRYAFDVLNAEFRLDEKLKTN